MAVIMFSFAPLTSVFDLLLFPVPSVCVCVFSNTAPAPQEGIMQ